MVKMAKAYGLNIYNYLKFLLDKRPDTEMSNEGLEMFAPGNTVRYELPKR